MTNSQSLAMLNKQEYKDIMGESVYDFNKQ